MQHHGRHSVRRTMPLGILLATWSMAATAQNGASSVGNSVIQPAPAASTATGTVPAISTTASAAADGAATPPTAAMPTEPTAPPSGSAVASAVSSVATPPTQAAPPNTAIGPPGIDWDAEFSSAKADFIAGRFKLAMHRFETLVAQARTPIERARVEELLQASREWAARDVTLVEQRELVGSDLLSRRSDRRTADEIGVLYLSSIVYGLGTGLWLDTETEPDTTQEAILPPLLLAGAAVGGVALIDSGKGLRYGTAQSISTGMAIGFWQGLAWGTYYQATSSYYDQMKAENYVTVLWGTTTAGAIAGGVIGSINSTTPGRASFVGSATIWPALVFGLGAAGLSSDDPYRDDHAMLASAIGASAGTIGGVLAAGAVSPTTARVRFLDLGAIGGGLAVGGLTLAFCAEETRDGSEIYIATDLGIVAGLGLAWWLTDEMPRDLGADKLQTAKPTVTPTVLPQRGGLALGAVGTF